MAASALRTAELVEFDERRVGVKDLLDTAAPVPPIFHQIPPPSTAARAPPSSDCIEVPVVDLSLPHAAVLDLIRAAARGCGMFQITNHGIPSATIDAALSDARSFHDDLPTATRAKYYARVAVDGIAYQPFFNVHKKLNWGDTLYVNMGRAAGDPARVPPVCQDALATLHEAATEVARALTSIFSEALGVGESRLEEMMRPEPTLYGCNYYPPSPTPEETMGAGIHTDDCLFTLVLHDGVEGLYVKSASAATGHDDSSHWVLVPPVPGAIVVNVGDILQMVSNDYYKTAEHLVLSSGDTTRLSIAVFVNPTKQAESDVYGPLPELLSPTGQLPRYRGFTMPEFMAVALAKENRLHHFAM